MPKRPPSILFLGLLDISKIGPMSLTPVAFITGDIFFGFLGKRDASEESHTQTTGEALLARFTLAFARLKNAKKITPVMQAITPGPRLKVEFMKKQTRLAHRQEGKAFLV